VIFDLARTSAAACLLALLFAGCSAEAPTCGSDADCATGFSCIESACTPIAGCGAGRVSCSADGECSSKRCVSGCCAAACASALDCRETEACRAGVCEQVEFPCNGAADCSATSDKPYCMLAKSRCVACILSTDCPTGKVCNEENRCALPPGQCDAQTPCKAGEKCLSSGLCSSTTECATNADCAAPRAICGAGGQCVECGLDAQCGSGKRCLSGSCVPLQNGCLADGDCISGHCRTADRTCVSCLTREHCGPLQQCSDNSCVSGPCASDAECAQVDGGRNPRCVSGSCRSCTGDADCAGATPRCRTTDNACVACLANDDCFDGESCSNSVCVVRSGVGVPCGGLACPAGLTCVPEATGSFCRAPCSLSAPRCPASQLCGLVGFDTAGTPEGACRPATGAAVGALCNESTTPCRPDLVCLLDAPNGVRHCHATCTVGAAPPTCTTPEVCQPVVKKDARNVPRTFGACLPDTNIQDPCQVDAGCGAGKICGAAPNPASPLVVQNICNWTTGTAETAAACTQDGQCKSNLCLPSAPNGLRVTGATTASGYCQGACSADGDCPALLGAAQGRCVDIEIPWSDATGQSTSQGVASCVPPCTSEAVCQTNDSCVLAANHAGTAWAATCTRGNDAARGKWGGSTCKSDAECWSGSCLRFGTNGTDGFCLGVCRQGSTGDCKSPGECAPHGVLRAVSAGPDGLSGTSDDLRDVAPICWGRTCLRDADCAGQSADATKPRACAPRDDPRNPGKDLLLSCLPREGASGAGAACTANTDCATGMCLGWTQATSTKRACFGGCTISADCAAGSTCTTRLLYSGSTTQLSLCVPTFP
jgi:hypothetical protein